MIGRLFNLHIVKSTPNSLVVCLRKFMVENLLKGIEKESVLRKGGRF